jgi:SAM-dependent methyltransferase
MRDLEETQAFWDRVAEDWKVQVGDEGDSNRRMNSDPVLWKFAGDVVNREVLDAGCGTGYLSKKLHDAGAHVTGIDFSERMIAIARAAYPAVAFRVDSCSELSTVANGAFEVIVSNYVLMDTPRLEETMHAFHRALRPGGIAVLIFSHPCFPQSRATPSDTGEVVYRWEVPYFQQGKRIDPPWAHFKSEFIWFHRPLSDYWKAFSRAGFDVVDFEEPRVTEDRYHLARSERHLRNSRTRAYSVAFKLKKAL